MKMKIIGVAGTNGAGKDVLGIMLAERHRFLNATATNMFLDELKERGWPPDREHKAKLSAEWRREHGMGVIVDKAVEMFEKEPGKYNGIVVGSLRHPGEMDRVHELGGTTVWIDADPRVRYDRIQRNLHERVGTHVEADKTFEEFLAEQEREMTPVGDEATLHLKAVKDRADIFLDNDGDDIETFKKEAEAVLKNIIS
jgi:cytidylate kinase